MQDIHKTDTITLIEADCGRQKREQHLAKSFNTLKISLLGQLIGVAGAALAAKAGDNRIALFALLLPVPCVLSVRLGIQYESRTKAKWTACNEKIRIHNSHSFRWKHIADWSANAYNDDPQYIEFTITIRKNFQDSIVCEYNDQAKAFLQALSQRCNKSAPANKTGAPL